MYNLWKLMQCGGSWTPSTLSSGSRKHVLIATPLPAPMTFEDEWVELVSSPVSLWPSGRKRKALRSEVRPHNAGLIKSFRRCCPCFHFLEEIVVEMVWWNSLVIPSGPGAFFWRGAINYWSNSFNRYRPIQMIYFSCWVLVVCVF